MIKALEDDRIAWIVPPRCQGQIVERAYALVEEVEWRRTTDRSDGSVSYERREGEYGSWEPWNREPSDEDWEPAERGPEN